MPRASRSIEEIEEIQDSILDHAFNILTKDGYDGLSMDKLGSMMNMTGANLYNYYSSKDELLIAIHKRTFDMLHNELRNAVADSNIPRERLQKMLRAFVEFGLNNINIYDIMFNRPILQNSDYSGTPLEAISLDEYQNSVKTLEFAVNEMSDFIKTRPYLNGSNPKFMTIKTLSALHGIISLRNSRIIFEMDDNSEKMLNDIIDEIINSITG
jgi:AcrR family transcriptional regulator